MATTNSTTTRNTSSTNRNLPRATSNGATIQIRDVQMFGPSVNAIRWACQEVCTSESASGSSSMSGANYNTGTTGAQQQGTRRTMSPAARARIAAAQRKRHQQERQQQQSSSSKPKAMTAGGGSNS